MHNKKVKFLSILCAGALISSGMPVSAEEVTANEEGTQSVIVTASISPDYTVTIPKTLTLNKEGTAEYTVTASGEIEKLSTLTVTPDESFALTTAYDSATAKVSQEKTAWSATDLMTDSEQSTTGSVVVDGGLAPGEWSGTFNFEIALNEYVHVHEYKTNGPTAGHTCDICDTSEEHVDTDIDYYCDACSEFLPGLYDENDVMTVSWDELLENGTIHVTDGVLTTNASYLSNSSANTLVGKLIIDDSVTSLGDSAIYYCKNLTSITIPDSVTNIGLRAFYGCSSFTSITIPDSVTSIGDGAFEGCSGLTSINIPSSVTSIGNGVFGGCSNLPSITIPTSVTSIGYRAFVDCDSLTSIDIPSSVTSIGSGAFINCSGLTNIRIPDTVTSLGNGLFADCSSLTSITIPDSVTSIEYYAFHNCSSLTSVTIPSNVTSIGEDAFRNCGAFTINYKGAEEQWNAITKDSNWNLDSTITMNYNYTE